MIDKETEEEIKSRIDIVEVISGFVSLKKQGKEYVGLSPFTNEKTPSFTVNPVKGIFKDFSSQKGGDAITFLREHEGLSYVEALQWLAKKYGIIIREKELTPAEVKEREQRSRLLSIMAWAARFYAESFRGRKGDSSHGQQYMTFRGFSPESCQKFNIGYAVDAWETLVRSFLEAKRQGYLPGDVTEDDLVTLGLAVRRKSKPGYFDALRYKVMFPIHNDAGQVIAFGARTLYKKSDEEHKHIPKYVNSPESIIYTKGKNLYGLTQAKHEIVKQKKVYLMEGYTDVIAFDQAGVHNCLGSGGTALTEHQASIIARYASDVTLVFDGDSAGQKATNINVDILLKKGLNVRIVGIASGRDPHSLVMSMKDPLRQLPEYIDKHEQDFIMYFTRDLFSSPKIDVAERANRITNLISKLALVSDPIKLELYLKECARVVNLSMELLRAQLNALKDANKSLASQGLKELKTPAPVFYIPKSVRRDREQAIQSHPREAELFIIRIATHYATRALAPRYFLSDFVSDLQNQKKITWSDYKNREAAKWIARARSKSIKTDLNWLQELVDQEDSAEWNMWFDLIKMKVEILEIMTIAPLDKNMLDVQKWELYLKYILARDIAYRIRQKLPELDPQTRVQRERQLANSDQSIRKMQLAIVTLTTEDPDQVINAFVEKR